jgi:hypothetical protein
MSPSNGSLVISGGWNADYSLALGSASDPLGATEINANLLRSGLRVQASAGVLELRRLRFFRGRGVGPDNGGNLSAEIAGSAHLRLHDVHFLEGSATHVGAGALIALRGAARLEANDCTFQQNQISAANAYFGVGLAINAGNNATASLTRMAVLGGEGVGGVEGYGSGIDVLAGNEVVLTIADSVLSSNTSSASSGASVVSVLALNSAVVSLERVRVQLNNASASASHQVLLDRRDQSTIHLSNSVISDSSMAALAAVAQAGVGGIVLNNLTLTRNAAPGLLLDLGGSLLTLNNSIVHNNGMSLLKAVGVNNLGANVGLPAPSFAGPSDYRLAAGSPGIDQGTVAVPMGLGAFDVDRKPRVVGLQVDIGASEFVSDVILRSGFE